MVRIRGGRRGEMGWEEMEVWRAGLRVLDACVFVVLYTLYVLYEWYVNR